MNIESITGLEMLQAIIDGDLPHPSIASTIPMTFREVENGRVLFEAQAGEQHMNPLGGTHGGFVATDSIRLLVAPFTVRSKPAPALPLSSLTSK